MNVLLVLLLEKLCWKLGFFTVLQTVERKITLFYLIFDSKIRWLAWYCYLYTSKVSLICINRNNLFAVTWLVMMGIHAKPRNLWSSFFNKICLIFIIYYFQFMYVFFRQIVKILVQIFETLVLTVTFLTS